MFGIAKKLQYAYLPDNLVSKYNIDPAKHAKLKKTHGKVRKLFKGLQGKESNLRKAILKGAKQKSSDFSLKGVNGLLADLRGLEAIGELAELGDMGAVATGASVAAASGVLAKIGSWLKPIKNIFSKVKGKFKKAAPVTDAVSQFTNQPAPTTEAYAPPTNSIMPQSGNYSPQPILKSGNYTAQSPTVPNPNTTSQKKISKGAKIGIGLGVAALIGTGAYFVFRKKEGVKPKGNASSKKSPDKKSLGSIELQ
jgi:hypothetical protein